MSTAREIMSGSPQCASADDTLTEAARKMRDLSVGFLPICGEDERLSGVVTDRDIVLRVADGADPAAVPVADIAEGKPVTVGADDAVEEVLRTMSEHGVRRLPVIDGHRLVGVVSQADVARHLPDDRIGELVAAISSAPSDR
jgi:CBS domain-containing protein